MQAHLQRASNKHRGQENNSRQSQRLNTSRFADCRIARTWRRGRNNNSYFVLCVHNSMCIIKYWMGGGKPPETLFIPVHETGARRQHFVNTRPIKIKNLVLQLAPVLGRWRTKFKSRLVSSISLSDRPGPVWSLNSVLVLDSQSTSAWQWGNKRRQQNKQKARTVTNSA